MKSLILVAATVLSLTASVSAGGHNTEEVVCTGNNDVCKGGNQSGPAVSVPVTVPVGKRTIMDLFRGAAVKREAATVSQIAAQVASHSLDPSIKSAAIAAGWTPPSKRDLGIVESLVERATKGGAKGGATGAAKGGAAGGNITPAAAAAHLSAGKPIPEPIQKAAIAAGWTPPGGKKQATAGGKTGAATGKKTGGAAGKKTKPAKRDGIYAREAGLSHKQVHSLLHHMENNPEAEEFVMNAINNDPNVEEFTEKLAGKWLKAREVIPVAYLAERDAEAAANRAADASFNQFVEKRDALPEADADAEQHYFDERDAYPEASFEIDEREADPEAEAYYQYFEERDAAPESWVYDYDY
ncbi:hypothetical protein MMC27_002652 [Xylographa pallens]|nr:hypothetical protein [Xylographa pallens]